MPKKASLTKKNKGSRSSTKEARARLLSAVQSLASRHGIEGTSTREIANEAGCNISLISYYFGGKEGLYKEALHSYAEEVRNLATEFMSSALQTPMTRESFKKMIAKIIDYSCDLHTQFPEMQILLFRELSGGMPQSRELFDKVFFNVVKELDTLMEKAKKAKIIRSSMNTRAYLISIFHLVDSFFIFQRFDNEISRSVFSKEKDIEEFKQHILTLLLDGGMLPS
jgi:AcrR family transcriptional regulator